jgi:hypothetical protein
MRNQVLRDFRRHAVDEVDHPGWHPSIGEAADQLSGRGGRLLRRLDDDRAARCQRAGQFAHNLVDRKIPRCERRHRADRLLHHELVDALGPCGDDAAIGAARFLGEPVDDVGAGEYFTFGVAQWLALFEGQERCDRIDPLAQHVGRLAHDFRAVERRYLAPRAKAFVGGFERAVEIALVGMGDGADRLAGRGVDDRDRATAGRFGPLPVEEQQYVGIHSGCPHSTRWETFLATV